MSDERKPPYPLSANRRPDEQSYWFCSRKDGTHEDGCAQLSEGDWPFADPEPSLPCAPDCALPDWPHHGPCAAVST